MAGLVITDPDRTLLALDTEIRRGGKGVGARAVVIILASFALLTMYAITYLAADSARTTVAALCALLVVTAPTLAPLVTGVGERGLAPHHVRHLPVPAGELRRGLVLVSLRSGAFAFLFVGLFLGVFALPGASVLAHVVAVLVAAITAVVALILSRVAALRLAAALGSATGRIVTAVVGAVVGGAAYSLFVLLGNVSLAFADNDVLSAAVRIAPSGWIVTAGEAVDDGRWWLPVVILMVLVAAGMFLMGRWTAAVSDALDGSPSRRDPRAERSTAPTRMRGPLLTVVSAEATQLMLDARRVGLLMMPTIFLVVGVVLMVTSNDVYGMKYGALIVMLIAANVFSNSYGLDGPAFWRTAVVPGAAQRIVDARMILGAAVATVFGVVGTVLGHTVGGGSWADVPVAAAVIVSGAASVAAIGVMQSALSPFSVAGQTAGSAMNARGSMSGPAVGWSLGLLAAAALACLPGALTAVLLDGPLAWLGIVVSAVIGAATVAFARRKAVALVAERGPEIFEKVSRAP